jgi:alpha-amylase
MDSAGADYPGYSVITGIDLGDETQLEVCFNDGNGHWDNNGGNNYIFAEGVSTFKAGTIYDGAPSTVNNKATIYYKSGFKAPRIHYKKANGAWTDVPGVQMISAEDEYPGYFVFTDIEMGDDTQLEVCFNDGNGQWDNNGGNNYIFPQGTSTFKAGTIIHGTPQTANNKVTIFYKSGFAAPRIHYRKADGNWTDVPGVQMENLEGLPGYFVCRDIEIGDNTELEFCFNDGNGQWDNNGGKNYKVPVGTFTIKDGTIIPDMLPVSN